jgi:hypothetical protein
MNGHRGPAAGLAVAMLLLISIVWDSAAGSAASSTSAPTTAKTSTTRISKTSTPKTSTPSTVPRPEPQTVLSPIGLNVRTAPSKTAKVIVTAAQRAVLERLAYTNQGGGWYKVRGPTVTGWVSSSPTYSAPGHFGYWQSSAFSVLFPAGWSVSGSPHSGVTFHSHLTAERVVITEASSIALLASVSSGGGNTFRGSQQVVACGVSGHLDTYTTSAAGHYIANVAFIINAHHALGMTATLTSLAELPTVLDFVNSVSFPFPVCVG